MLSILVVCDLPLLLLPLDVQYLVLVLIGFLQIGVCSLCLIELLLSTVIAIGNGSSLLIIVQQRPSVIVCTVHFSC